MVTTGNLDHMVALLLVPVGNHLPSKKLYHCLFDIQYLGLFHIRGRYPAATISPRRPSSSHYDFTEKAIPTLHQHVDKNEAEEQNEEGVSSGPLYSSTAGYNCTQRGCGGDQSQGVRCGGDQSQGVKCGGEQLQGVGYGGEQSQGVGYGGEQSQGVRCGGEQSQGVGYGGEQLQGVGYGGEQSQGVGYGGEQSQGVGYGGEQSQGVGYGGEQSQGVRCGGDQSQGVKCGGEQLQGVGYGGEQSQGVGYGGEQSQGVRCGGEQSQGVGYGGEQSQGVGYGGEQSQGVGYGGEQSQGVRCGGDQSQGVKCGGEQLQGVRCKGDLSVKVKLQQRKSAKLAGIHTDMVSWRLKSLCSKTGQLSILLTQPVTHICGGSFSCFFVDKAGQLPTAKIFKTNVTITNDKSDFLKSVSSPWDSYNYNNYYYHISACNQSLLYGLKRALEISPAESVIMVYTFGSMADYNDTQLLSDVYTLLKEKKSQVYFLRYPGYCAMTASQQDVLNKISSVSYGEFIDIYYTDYYKLINLLELQLSKPLNSSVQILNVNVNVTDKYTKVFNVTTSLTYLLITGNEAFTLNFTDPNGKTFTFQNSPYYYYSYYTLNTPSSHLVKSPAAGSWVLNAHWNSSLSLQILGFTGDCLNSDCHPNATCSEFGGYGDCTCKEGFSGDGTSCNDINECQDYFTNNCNYYGSGSCVNTVGSYTCYCSSGFKYMAEFGCVDIDECADSSLNDCDPVAICTNYYYGSYTCTCPYGYYGNGKHCEVNECQQGTPCKSNEDCNKYIGSYSCTDPCYNYTVLNDPWRSTSNTYNYNYGYDYYNWFHCDYSLSGWYRFKGEYDQQIPERCVPQYSCGTYIPIWMNGSHPAVSDGVVNRTACSNWYSGCCTEPFNISVRMCPEGFYVYKLQGTPGCNYAYCTESDYSCSGVECAPDEECRMVDGNSGCYCKNSSYAASGIQSGNIADYLTPQVTCGLGNIEVRFSKCLLENLGYDTSSIHLRDNYCRGAIERLDKSYITLITRPTYGSCGGYNMNDGTDITYTNTVYLTAKSTGVIIRDDYAINFHCSYPSNMEINLLTAVSSFITYATINVSGTANFTITMGLFQDSGYTIPYTDSQVSLNSTSMLYVGVIVTGATSSSPFVLVMKNCYATPTADSAYGPRYDIITERCPNRNDPTISVPENGVSLKGRFSLQVFKFLGGYNQIYLHCQIGLCDTSSYDCSANCFSMRSALSSITGMKNMTIGPIQKSGTTLPTAKLFIPAIVFLLLLY
ncbi:uncharacterized protein ACMZJ9_009835 [Mantella aurantiaca]